MDTKGVVSLDYAVNLVLMDLDDYSLTFYKKFLQYAILGFQDLNLYVSQSVKVAYIPVKENLKAIDLPDDYITYTKIGYNNGGTIATLALNEDLMIPRNTDDCGNTINENTGSCGNESTGQSTHGYYYSPHYRNGQFVGELYAGAGGRRNDGYYRVDEERRMILFSSDIAASEIILEYKSSGISGDGSTLVKREFIPAIRAYIHWQRRAYNDAVAESKKIALMNQYYTEYEKVKDLEVSFTIEEYLASTRATYRQSPKR